mgnify:CR=1 FL=1
MKDRHSNNNYSKPWLLVCLALTLGGCISDADGPDESGYVVINQAPSIDSEPPLTAQTNTEYRYNFSASDADSDDTVTLSASVLPAWLTFDATTGLLSGTPGTADVGEHSVTLVASDGKEDVSQSFTISVAIASSGGNWTLVWSDEFNGSTLDENNWTVETGDGSQYGIPGWGNNEQEWYQADNISLVDGNLVITAKEEASNGYPYTSGRLKSDSKVDIKYGRIEARAKVPLGQGLWSAFWMLPTDSQYGGWASGGEIDIMEAVSPSGNGDDLTYGTIHYGMAWPMNVKSGGNASLTPIDEFHTYAVEWQQDEIRWYIDDLHYATVTSDTWWSYYYAGLDQGYISAPQAPFDQRFHLLLNLAVGGNWPGSPNADTLFPAKMLIDYVRVYQCDTGLETGAGCANNINPTVEAPAAANVYTASQVLFQDGIAPLNWQVAGETVTRALTVGVAWDNGGITLAEQDIGGDHGQVLDINTSDMGNVAISAADGNRFDLFGMGNAAQWWELAAGELKFDLFIDSALTPDEASISIKMDSGWPALGYKTLAVSELEKDTWISLSVPINDLIATPGQQALNLAEVQNLFVIEFSAAAHVQLDNIQLVCGHKDDKGCGIKPPAIEVTDEVVEVFTDTVNETVWTNGMGAWDSLANTDYYQGDTGNHVNWQLLDSGEAGHDTVLEVAFNADGGDGVNRDAA